MFFNLGSAEPRGSSNSIPGSLKMLKIVIYRTFRFCQVTRNFQEVPRIEKGWKTLVLFCVYQWSKSTSLSAVTRSDAMNYNCWIFHFSLSWNMSLQVLNKFGIKVMINLAFKYEAYSFSSLFILDVATESHFDYKLSSATYNLSGKRICNIKIEGSPLFYSLY